MLIFEESLIDIMDDILHIAVNFQLSLQSLFSASVNLYIQGMDIIGVQI